MLDSTTSPRPSGGDTAPSASLVGMRVYLDSLGCAKNLVDSEASLGLLSAAGLRPVDDPERADVLLVNTCGFLEAAREESIERILELAQLKAYGRARLLGVMGCLVSRAPEELAESIPEVDVWLPAGTHGVLEARLAQALGTRGDPELRRATDRSGSGRAPAGAFAGFGQRVLRTAPHTAYLKISEGCTNTCSFCSIPLMRGTQRSREIHELVTEARALAARGVRELHLVAQDLTHYGYDLGRRADLLDLVRALSGVDGIEWLRLLYAHPSHLSDRMLHGLFEVPKMARYLDMPIQHASDRMLRAMRRPYTAERVRRQVEFLRDRYPDITLRTTVIVGFPGETERDFVALCRFLEDTRWDRLGIFAYSREPGTPAYALRGRPRDDTVQRRIHELTDLQMHVSATRNAARVGTRVRVLIDAVRRPEDDAQDGSPFAAGAAAVGRSQAEALDIDGTIYLHVRGSLEPGRFVDARLVDADAFDLRGQVETAAAVVGSS